MENSQSVARQVSLKEWVEQGEENFAINTGNDNEYWKRAYDDLIKLGCMKVSVGSSDNNCDYMDMIFIELPENISASLLCYICELRPDETNVVSKKVLKLWWD